MKGAYESICVLMLCLMVMCAALEFNIYIIQPKEVTEAEVRYYQAQILFDTKLLVRGTNITKRGMEVIDKQSEIIAYQRRLIERIAGSPCSERAMLAFHPLKPLGMHREAK